MGKKRQQDKQQEIKNNILAVAREIVSSEGVQGLSIRKISNALDYSPGSIYHYFKDKNEIIETLVNEGYGKILAAIRSVPSNSEKPDEELKQTFTDYIKAALKFPEEYKAFMLNDDPAIIKRTGLLEKGISERSQSLKRLYNNIQKGISKGIYVASLDPELTAQIIWTATFGLIIKIMLEKGIGQEQIDRLIDQHFMLLFHGILEEKK